jgi:signal transduction histidine kinase
MIYFDRFVPADLDGRYAERLIGEARRAVVRQTAPTTFAYPLVVSWVGISTDQASQAPVVFWAVLGLLSALMMARATLLILAWRVLDRDVVRTTMYLVFGVVSSCVLSGYIGYISVTAAEGPSRHLGVAIMIAIGGSLIALVSIHRRLATAWVFASLVPMAIFCIVAGDPVQRALMMLIAPYLGMTVHIVGMQHRTYWSSRVNAARLDAQMVEANRLSRLAGMAEIAVSVLHDVGNVLNSVLTSTGVLDKELREGETTLHDVAKMLDVPREELVAFAANDRRAVVVGPYLRELATARDRRDERLRTEVARVRTGVDHLVHVVSRQQQHARGSSLIHEVELDGLLEQAVDFVRDSVVAGGIVLDPPESTGVAVCADRHQTLQILVNLLANARDAVKGRRAGKIGMSVRAEAKAVHVMITDDGCGFDEVTARRLFVHGFTTKPHGHGFGLHHSILLARAMGGELSGASAGVDRGATFTLTLPRSVRAVGAIERASA